MLKRIHEAYAKMFRGEGKHSRWRKSVRAFESVKGVGRLRFVDKRGLIDNAKVRRWRIVRHALGGGNAIQLVIKTADFKPAPDSRPSVGVDFGLKLSRR